MCHLWSRRDTTADKLKKCSRCRFIYYCDESCQKKDWEEHRPLCEEYAKKGDLKDRMTSYCNTGIIKGNLPVGNKFPIIIEIKDLETFLDDVPNQLDDSHKDFYEITRYTKIDDFLNHYRYILLVPKGTIRYRS
jgi:hypothetical protein